jgi:hypothetical protein
MKTTRWRSARTAVKYKKRSQWQTLMQHGYQHVA